ncbi:hypothetical protein CPSG_06286 [Coccidioides posadasii str. Silveira]|uniref:Uncharacterized protein n=1 Tax=Coccidioides posadasii (strain RMSCC 757 / Silveira) TaxID=443226 RepID=E9D8Y4_COCPS|nr:hypothetical protein CPSG_06286 [Coccidioides posadasii str. Silveira]
MLQWQTGKQGAEYSIQSRLILARKGKSPSWSMSSLPRSIRTCLAGLRISNLQVINCCNSLADYLPCGGLSFQPTFIQFPIFRGRTAIWFVFPRFIAPPGAGIGNGCHIVRRQWKANGTKALHSQAGI